MLYSTEVQQPARATAVSGNRQQPDELRTSGKRLGARFVRDEEAALGTDPLRHGGRALAGVTLGHQSTQVRPTLCDPSRHRPGVVGPHGIYAG
jgi:hypothetical protein